MDDDLMMQIILANVAADVSEGKYGNWQAKQKPPLGVMRQLPVDSQEEDPNA